MFERVLRGLATTRGIAEQIGWRWAIADRVSRILKIHQLGVRVSGVPDKVAVRMASSDMWEFSHLLGRNGISFSLPFEPEYIIDAGANVGYSALRFKLDHPAARVVGLEPEPGNARQFQMNCRSYPDIALEQAALWPTSTRLRITNPSGGDNAYQVSEDERGDILALTVTEVMERHGFPRVDVLKIDIEGSERALFSSNTEWLDRVRMIVIETHDRFVPGCTEALEAAVCPRFEFRGMLDDYACYVRVT
jgi:FkbM family methyltransferase